MIEGKKKVLQAFLGTLLTWGLTSAASALVFVFQTGIFDTHQIGAPFFIGPPL